MGFVKTDELPAGDASVEENRAQSAGEPEKIEQSTAQATVETAAETAKPENQSTATGETANLENQITDVAGQAESAAATQDSDAVKTEVTPAAVAPDVESKPQPVAATVGKTATQTPNEKEPFEFGKCTVNLNLVLLPCSGDSKRRKVIASAVSHNLPPEIDFLEIVGVEDLTQIGDLVRDKLSRFKQSLPAKYIEQLRASKTNRAKSGAAVTKATSAAPTQAAINQANAEKTSGGQNTPETNRVETEKQQSALPKENNPGASSLPVPTVNRSVAANDVQQSLF